MLRRGDLTAGEIAEQFNLTKPSISHHLNVLKQAGLVQDVRKGQNIYYSLNTTVFQDVLGWFFEVMGSHDDKEKVRVRKETRSSDDPGARDKKSPPEGVSLEGENEHGRK